MQHGQIPRNRCFLFARCLNAWPWCLLFTWLRRWLPSFGLSWHILPKGSMMTGRRICYAPTTGCSPSFRKLLHSSSRYNATRTGERNRPSSGLARISAHPRPPKKLKPSASGTRFTDWIGGVCYADTLQVWFPAHGAPVILHQLQHTEDAYRAAQTVGELFSDWHWLLPLASEEENGDANERQQRSCPRWQKGHCLALRQSTWGWHVQVRHEAARIQEDVPERRLG